MLELAGGALDRRRRRARRACPSAPVVRFRPERADALIGIETPPERQYALLGRLGFERDGENVVVPTWRARDVTREVDVIEEIARFRLEDVPFTLPARREMFGRLTREQRCGAASRTRSSASASPRRTRRACVPDDDTTVEAARADLGRADRAADDAHPEPRRGRAAQRRRGRAADRAVRDRARLPRRTATCRTSACASRASPRAASCARRASSRRCTRRSRPSRRSSAPRAPLLHPGKTARTPAGVVGEVHPRLLEGTWGAFELDLDAPVRAPRASR